VVSGKEVDKAMPMDIRGKERMGWAMRIEDINMFNYCNIL